MLDLENALQQVQIHEGRLNQLYARDRRAFRDSLDRQDEASKIRDAAAIQAATDRHNAMRAEAEAELARHYQQIEEEERRQAEQERLRLEAERARARAEAEKKAKEEAERLAKIERERQAAQKAAEDKAKSEELERLRREVAAKQKQQKEAEEAKQAAEAREKAQQQKASLEQAAKAAAEAKSLKQQAAVANAVANAETARLRQRYLDIHQNLKKFRKDFWALCKTNPALKAKVGEMRRALKVSVGQLIEKTASKPQANAKPTLKVKQVFQEAISIESPLVDARNFFANPPLDIESPEASQIPSLLVYAFNIFSKAIISQFSNEASLNIKAAEPAGVLTAQIFAAVAFKFHNHSLIDILLAKLHFSCPGLWGAVGDEKTDAGRRQLGWRMEDGQFVSETRHQERMTGLAAGFAAIALRNFSKTQLINPYPPTNFWKCLATIVDIPASNVQPTHLFILRAMLELSTDKFVQSFGTAGVAALRYTLVNFPASLPPAMRNHSSTTALDLLGRRLAKDKHMHLA